MAIILVMLWKTKVLIFLRSSTDVLHISESGRYSHGVAQLNRSLIKMALFTVFVEF